MRFGYACRWEDRRTRSPPVPPRHPRPRPSRSAPDPRDEAKQEPPSKRAPDEVWLSSRDVSERLQIPLKALASWASAGHGPRYARMGRYRRYRLTDLQAWEQDRLDRTPHP